MIEEEGENAKLMAQLRFIGGQVHMLMDLCLTFISASSKSAELAQRFEATVQATLTHTDTKLNSQEFLDGELDIVNRVRRNVMSALPRKANQHEEIPVLLPASVIRVDMDKPTSRKSSASHALETLGIEWMERATELERSTSLILSNPPPDE